jgi:hypothetical protein
MSTDDRANQRPHALTSVNALANEASRETAPDAYLGLPEVVSTSVVTPASLAPRCPFCQSTETEPLSLFGSQLSTAQYYCYRCRTPFEYMRQE